MGKGINNTGLHLYEFEASGIWCYNEGPHHSMSIHYVRRVSLKKERERDYSYIDLPLNREVNEKWENSVEETSDDGTVHEHGVSRRMFGYVFSKNIVNAHNCLYDYVVYSSDSEDEDQED